MPIYRATLKGRRKTVLVRADSAAQARDQLVSVSTLSAADMADAIDEGEAVWKPGQELPADDPEPEPEAEEQSEAVVEVPGKPGKGAKTE